MPDPTEFEVYQGPAGYVAVTNETRRKILAALAKKERDLGELVKLTGKAKPTLSNLHVRELLAQKLVEEVAHPTDQRKKIYRLVGQRIGSSSVPIEELRGAVKRYVSASPMAHAVPLRQVLDVLAAGGARAGPVVGRQAARLGELSAHLFPATSPRELLPRVAEYFEREGITRTARIDYDPLALDLDVDPALADGEERLALVGSALAGFVAGAASRFGAVRAAPERLAKGRVRLRLDA